MLKDQISNPVIPLDVGDDLKGKPGIQKPTFQSLIAEVECPNAAVAVLSCPNFKHKWVGLKQTNICGHCGRR